MKLATTLVLAVFLASAVESESEKEVRNTISRANVVWIKAGRTLVKADLESIFAGPALAEADKQLELGRQSGFYLELELLELKYEQIRIDDSHAGAVVVTFERWQSTVRRRDSGECLVRQGPRQVRQTYTLKRSQQQWQIYDVKDDPGNPKARAEPCTEADQ